MDQALNSQKTPHTSPLRASYGMSFVSILMKNDRVIKGFYCSYITYKTQIKLHYHRLIINIIQSKLHVKNKIKRETHFVLHDICNIFTTLVLIDWCKTAISSLLMRWIWQVNIHDDVKVAKIYSNMSAVEITWFTATIKVIVTLNEYLDSQNKSPAYIIFYRR